VTRATGVVFVRLALIGVTLALAACSKEEVPEVESETVVSVKAAPAMLGDIRAVVHATGIVNPAPGAELLIVAPEAARIAAMPFAAGDRVTKGDVLVRFDIPNAAAEVERQQAEVARAQAGVENARAAATRATALFDRGVAAHREAEDANRGVADATAALAQAQASFSAAQSIASRTVVRATFNGLVAKRGHNPGDVVEPSASDPVLHVIDPQRLEVVAAVPLGDAQRITLGAAGRLVSGAGAAGELKVVSRPAAVEAGTGTVPVRLAFTGATRIPMGTPVQLDIEAEHHKGVVLVSAVAIVREGDETAVFVVADGKAHRRAVQIGLTNATQAEIVSGIKAGEQVVVDGQAGLPDEAAVAVNGPAAKEPAK
jgi:RND family efflux transporter MFP subunit